MVHKKMKKRGAREYTIRLSGASRRGAVLRLTAKGLDLVRANKS